MKKRGEPKKVASAVSRYLEIPLDVLSDVPRITISDNRELTVENFRCIEAYEPELIRLRSKKYRISIEGKNLEIGVITDEEITVYGVIQSVTLLS